MANMFDTYSRQARLRPALFALFPIFLSIAIWVPALYNLVAGLLSLSIACGATVYLAHLSRAFGRKIEPTLFALWGGKPTTQWLAHSDRNLDSQTKARYHAFFEANIESWKAPSPTDEREDSMAAELAYESAVRWLREVTRDRAQFELIFNENVSYGFRRNLYGLKSLALTIGSVCLLGNGVAIFYVLFTGTLEPRGIASLLFNLVVILAWVLTVRESRVKDAADSYARALLAACDQLSRGNVSQGK